jgi:hypothetical protein
MYLSETKIFRNSLNRVSKAVLVIAIKTKEKINKQVAQSLGSKILGCKTFSIIILAKLLIFYLLNYYKIIKLLH